MTEPNIVARTLKRMTGEIPILLMATFVLSLNETIVAVALPRIMADLTIEPTAAQWVSSSFMLAMAIVIPMTGFLMQRLSARTVYAISMSLFTVGTVIGALASDLAGLLVARSLQGAGTAIMLPLLLSTVMRSVPPHRRGRSMGNFAAVLAVAPAIGPGVGGAIVQVLDWRFLFISILPIAIVALVSTSRVMNTRPDASARLDGVSVLLSVPAFGGLVYSLSAFGSSVGGAVPMEAWTSLGCGALALVLFVMRQRSLQRGSQPFLDPSVFESRGFSVSVILIGLVMGALFGVGLLLPIYTQDVLGLGPAASGLLLIPGAILMGLAGPLIGRISDRVGPRPIVVAGTMTVGAVLWAMTGLTDSTGWELVLAADIGLSIGIAAIFTPIYATSMSSLHPRLYTHASSTLSVVQQLGGAAGSALFISLFSAAAGAAAVGGAANAEALVEGIRVAFGAGALVSLAAVVAALLIPRQSTPR